MQDQHNNLRDIVTYAIENNLELKDKSVDVSSFEVDDGDEMLKVELTLELTEKKLPKDIMYELVKSATKAVKDAGEDRFPIILPHLAEKQLLAARN